MTALNLEEMSHYNIPECTNGKQFDLSNNWPYVPLQIELTFLLNKQQCVACMVTSFPVLNRLFVQHPARSVTE
ncbi:hypothetical protein T10_1347 [Trichinella papuae]|uniref:Uncharacterized protein n=1 Tax=Trichinella papuae TaxID=268474 RepID=A0A0V1N028_9BILA|nr:hypothetical protein T10_1347 [Trichinella papuae]